MSQTPSRCWRCGAVFSGKPNHCPDCGARLPWEDEPRQKRGIGALLGGAVTILFLLMIWAARIGRVMRFADTLGEHTAQPVYFTSTPMASASARFMLGPPLRATMTSMAGPPPKAIPRPTVSQAMTCIPWQDADKYIGMDECICGVVALIKNSNTAGFIHFGDDTVSYYGVMFGYKITPGVLEGNCVQICGPVTNNYGRPRTVISDPDSQVSWCP